MAGIQPIEGVQAAPVAAPQNTAPRTEQAASRVVNQPADRIQSQDTQQDKDNKNAVQRKEPELENVVSVSKDGDTVQVKPEDREGIVTAQNRVSEEAQKTPAFKTDDDKETAKEQVEKMQEAGSTALEALKDEPTDRSKVLEEEKKEAEEKAAKEEAAKKEAEKKESAKEDAKAEAEEKTAETNQSPQDYTGMTDQQIEQLYEKGSIDRADYEKEMAKREDRKEDLTGGNERISEEMTTAAAEMNEAANAAATIENAYGENTEDPEAARVRVQAMEALNTAQTQNQ